MPHIHRDTYTQRQRHKDPDTHTEMRARRKTDRRWEREEGKVGGWERQRQTDLGDPEKGQRPRERQIPRDKHSLRGRDTERQREAQ